MHNLRISLSGLACASVCLLFILAPHSRAGQTDSGNAGTVSAAFLQINPSVRSAALGGDQVAASGEIESLFSNPAGLRSIVVPGLWLSHNEYLVDTRYETMAFGIPTRNQAFGAAVQYLNRGTFERTQIDASNAPITGLGNFRYSTTLTTLAWATRLNEKLDFGAGGKFWELNQDGSTPTGFASDFGVTAHDFFRSLSGAVAVRNVGPKYQGYDIPRSIAVGLSYPILASRVTSHRTTLFAEAESRHVQGTAARLGIEFSNDVLSLRTGFQNLTSDLGNSLAQFSFGIGLRIKGWKVDYAFLPGGDVGDQHRIAVRITFGLTPEERAQRARELDRAMADRARDRAQACLTDGNAALKSDQWSTAVSRFSEALMWDPQNKKASASLKLAQQKKNLADAEDHFEQGRALANDQQWLEAAFQFQQALKLNPNHAEAARSLKNARRRIEESRAHAENKNATAEDAYNQGVLFYLDGRYDDALKEWNRVKKADPSRPHLAEYIEKAKNKKLEQEVSALKTQAHPSDQDLVALNHQAYTFYSVGETRQAIKIWEKVLESNPNNADARLALNHAREKEQLIHNGSTDGEKSDVRDLNFQAMNAYSEGNLELAATLWRKALALDPTNTWIQNNLRRVESELAVKKLGK
jgi:tetratricopeptide (TPR) repeat protein